MTFIRPEEPRVISEIGCNHMGSMDLAKELISLSKACGAYAAKFQKRNNRELLGEEKYNAPHPVPHNSYGNTYGEHREFLELTQAQHAELKAYCDQEGIVYSTSVWDVTSANEIAELSPVFIKVPSATNINYGLLQVLRDRYEGEVHISFGMTYKKEQDEIVSFFEKTGVAKSRVVLYSCTSGYPVDDSDVCLLEILNLKERFGNRVKEVGFSGHHLGVAIDVAAYTLGARYVERHFTKNRAFKGTDHAASLEPAGLSKLVRDLTCVHAALQYKPQEILDVEMVQRKKLKE